MPNQPKPGNVPICFRPGTKPGDPDGDRAWLKRHAKETDRKVGAIVSEAVAQYRARMESGNTTRTTTRAPVAAKSPKPSAGRKAAGQSGTDKECKHPGVGRKQRCTKCGRYNI